MISLAQYFQAKPHTDEQESLATDLLNRVNGFIDYAINEGASFNRVLCPNTGSEISGSKGGAGDGGFRLATSTTGSQHSSHKEARAVDVYDPHGGLDDWISDFDEADGRNTVLEKFNLYREHPNATPGWCHLTTRAPGSGRRTFQP